MAAEAHLQMIQAVISRLASHSTTIKGWAVTVTAALLGFGATSAKPAVPLIAIYVILTFAALDAYYLALERLYRDLYTHAQSETATGWALNVDKPSLGQFLGALSSPPIYLLYTTSLVVALGTALYALLQ